MKKALLVIDIQNDYFEGGHYPLWNTENVLEKIEKIVVKAQQRGVEIINIQHIADSSQGLAPFFNEGTNGVNIHDNLLKLAPDSPIVVKRYADSFHETRLQSILNDLEVDEIYICGMMTQNCVTHTAISKAADTYKVSIVEDCCTTVDEMIHRIALNAVSTRVSLITSSEIFTEE